MQQSEQTKVVLHLGQAIDAQTKNNEIQAAEELEHALEAGFNHPALYYDLGLLRSKGDRLESAVRHLQHAVKHKDFGLASRLLMGQVNQKLGRLDLASQEYLEALKQVGTSPSSKVVVPMELSGLIGAVTAIAEAASTTDGSSGG
jgi:tetratricopeptide (TPR) repeat protein